MYIQNKNYTSCVCCMAVGIVLLMQEVCIYAYFVGLTMTAKQKNANWTKAYTFPNCPNSFILIIINKREKNNHQQEQGNWGEWTYRFCLIIFDKGNIHHSITAAVKQKKKKKRKKKFANKHIQMLIVESRKIRNIMCCSTTHMMNGPMDYGHINMWIEKESIFASCRSQPIRIH